VRSRIAVVTTIATVVALIVAAGMLEWSSDRMRPIADALQWLLLAGLLLAGSEVVRRLNRSESKLRALVGSLDEVILILDKEGRYIEIADTNKQLLYRPAQQMIGRRIHEVFPQDAAERFVAEIHRALASDVPTSVDYTLDIDGNVV